MLAGSDDYIKPDRMMSRFIYSAIQHVLSVEQMQQIMIKVHQNLIKEYPFLTLRLLDYLIWNYQRSTTYQ